MKVLTHKKTCVFTLTVFVALVLLGAAHECLSQGTPRSRPRTENYEADWRMDEGIRLFEQKSYQLSLGYFYRAAQLYGGMPGRDQREGKALIAAGLALEQLGRKDDAVDCYVEARDSFKSVGLKPYEITALNHLGSVYDLMGNSAKAIETFEEALEIEGGGLTREVCLLNNLGRAYLGSGNVSEALNNLSRASDLDQRRGAPTANLGVAYEASGDSAKAFGLYFEAFKKFPTYAKYEESLVLGRMGLVVESLGKYKEAKTLFTEASGRLNEDDNLREVAALNYFLASTLEHQELRREARSELNSSLAAYRKLRDKSGEAMVLNALGSLLDGPGDLRKALELYDKALELTRNVSDRQGEATVLFNLGSMYSDLGQIELANRFLTESSIITNSIGSLPVSSAGHLMATGPVSDLELAIEVGRETATQFPRPIWKVRKAQKPNGGEIEHSYRAIAAMLVSEGRIVEAEGILNQIKRLEFRSITATGAFSNGLNPYGQVGEGVTRLIDGLADLAGQRANLIGKESRTTEDDAKLTELDEKITTANAELRRSIEELLKTESVDFDIKQAQSLQANLRDLGNGTAALYTLVACNNDRAVAKPKPGETAPDPTKLKCQNIRTAWVILVTPDFRKAYPIDVNGLNENISQLRQALKTDKWDPAPLARKLYDKIFRQTSPGQKTTLESDLNDYFTRTGASTRTLMWSLDGVLRYVPMSVLNDGKNYLVDKYRMTVFTPASLVRLKDADRPAWNVFGLGVSEARDGFDKLPGARRELMAIIHDQQINNPGGLLPGTILLDQDFRRKSFLDGLRKGFSVVHLATHFSYKADQKESFLLLGDGRLVMGEMRDLPAIFENVDLLTLSACNTATSDADNGKEVEGLGIVSQSLGARSVIASLWDVPDIGTDELMIRFYANRKSMPGSAKIDLLRQAQLQLRNGSHTPAEIAAGVGRGGTMVNEAGATNLAPFRKDPKAPYAHPYYWAPFVLIGNWR